MTIDPQNPTDTSPAQVEHHLAGAGPAHSFRAIPGARIRCDSCGAEQPAAEHRADDVVRLEGVSDPADMTMVVPVECSNCGSVGTLTLGYGPDASIEDADVLAEMPRDPRA